MPPTAYIIHHSPGRVRLKIPSRRGDKPYFASLVRQLSHHPAIHELRADPRTAGLVVHHAGVVEAVLALAAEAELFITTETEIDPSKSLPPALLETTAAGLSGLALAQAARGEFLGSAAESFWHAYGSARILRRPRLAALFGALGFLQLLRGELLGSATSLAFYGILLATQAEHTRQAAGTHDAPADATPSEHA